MREEAAQAAYKTEDHLNFKESLKCFGIEIGDEKYEWLLSKLPKQKSILKLLYQGS